MIETPEHLFYNCKFACAFWEDCIGYLINLSELTKGKYDLWYMKDETHDLAIKTILGKFLLHKNTLLSTIFQDFYTFQKELYHYFLLLKLMKNKNTLNFCNLIKEPQQQKEENT